MASAIGELSYNTFEDETLAQVDRRSHPFRGSGAAQARIRPQDSSTFQVGGAVRTLPEENEIQSISRVKKAIAACFAAFTTSILMTPFDVVKTRLQVQITDPPTPPPPVPLSWPQSRYSEPSLSSSRQNSLKGRAERGLLTGQAARPTASHASDHGSPRTLPFSQVASRQSPCLKELPHSARRTPWPQPIRARIFADLDQTHRQPVKISDGPPRLNGMIDGFIQVGKREGVRGLWRGLTPTILMTVPSQVTYMVCYDFFKEHIGRSCRSLTGAGGRSFASSVAPEQLFTTLIAGATARSISATLVTPMELVRTRLQAADGDSHGSVRANMRLLVKDAKANPSSLWRGLGPTLYRDVPFSAIYLTAYESLKRWLTGGMGLGERRNGNGAHSHSSEFAVAFISGASAGILAALLTHPFDLAKTRQQVLSPPPGIMTTSQLLHAVYTREGVHGLLRGLSPRIAKVGPACGAMIGSFEVVGRLLDA